MITPTAPTTAFSVDYNSTNPVDMYCADICTVPVNIAGLPAISVPCGTDSKGLPIGMQIIGNKFREDMILNTAYFYQSNADCGVTEYDGGVAL